LFLQPQRLFERIGVGLVHLKAGVLFANPRFRVVETRLPLAGGHLLDADGGFHKGSRRTTQKPQYTHKQPFFADSASSASIVAHPVCLLKTSAALVPPKPNEFDSAYSIGNLRALFGT